MTLYLLPNRLHETADPNASFVPIIKEVLESIDGFFVENEKETRCFLSHFDFSKHRDKPMHVIERKGNDYPRLLDYIREGECWGVVSDAGLPCIADPGKELVLLAHERGIAVKALPGPSSIFLALMLSGLEGQEFFFGGYLPRKITPSMRKLTVTQIYIETPYNNQKSLRDLLHVLHDNDYLCVACDLMSSTEEVVTMRVGEWKKKSTTYDFHKRPAIFLIKRA